MADIFTTPDVQNLLKNKTIWFLGDSNVRASYKDLVWLIQKNSLISLNSLRAKLEHTFMRDKLKKGTILDRGRNYQEIRHYENNELNIKIEFIFLTKCLSQEVELRLKTARSKFEWPDVIVMNSCLWDIARWGPDGITNYKHNIVELMQLLKSYLPNKTLVIWTTTPPISKEPYGGLFIKQIEFMKQTIRFHVMEANMFVYQEVVSHGFDVLDVHFHLLLQIHRRRPDGIHWNVDAVRHITNLILTHIALSWNHPLPGRFISPVLEKMIELTCEPSKDQEQRLKKLETLLDDRDNSSPKRERNKRWRKKNYNGGDQNRQWQEQSFTIGNNKQVFINYTSNDFEDVKGSLFYSFQNDNDANNNCKNNSCNYHNDDNYNSDNYNYNNRCYGTNMNNRRNNYNSDSYYDHNNVHRRNRRNYNSYRPY